MKEYSFSAFQIAELAMAIEEEAGMAYEKLSGSVEEEEGRKIFISLSQSALGHKLIFKNIADDFKDRESTQYPIDIIGLLKDHIADVKKLSKKVSKPIALKAALKLGVKISQDTIEVYTDMRDAVIGRFHKMIDTVLNEEKASLEKMNGMIKKK